MFILEGLVGLHRSSFNFSFFSITAWDIDLDYHSIKWFALETNRYNSVIFDNAFNYCILDSFGGYDGYSISSKRLLPTVLWETEK